MTTHQTDKAESDTAGAIAQNVKLSGQYVKLASQEVKLRRQYRRAVTSEDRQQIETVLRSVVDAKAEIIRALDIRRVA